jgi:hypothetical protein
MVFYTCVSGNYRELAVLYEFCVKRVYPDAKVIISKEPSNPSCKRFLNRVDGDYIHVTDIDILILPHEKTHQEYYSQFRSKGACYLRGATEAAGKEWSGDQARIAGGHVGFFPEYYERTEIARSEYLKGKIEDYREFDEVMLARILRRSGYQIPEIAYTFPNGTKWDWDYRDLHLHDFATQKFLKWKPNREKVADLITDHDFREIVSGLSPYWRNLIHRVQEYALSDA